MTVYSEMEDDQMTYYFSFRMSTASKLNIGFELVLLQYVN